jgi:hypothetical protein
MIAAGSRESENRMEPTEKKVHKGVFLLPNALTTGALFAGFYSIISGINGHYSAAAVAVIVAGVLDGLDGRVARLTNTQSEFGVQYDSLSDLISFGLAPALLAFNWSLASLREWVLWRASWVGWPLFCMLPAALDSHGSIRRWGSNKAAFRVSPPGSSQTWFSICSSPEVWKRVRAQVIWLRPWGWALDVSRVRYHKSGHPAWDPDVYCSCWY